MNKLVGSLDSNVILRLLIRNEEDQYQLVKRLINTKEGQFALADTVFIEVAFVLRREYGLERDEVKMALEGIMGFRQFNCNRVMVVSALALYTHSTTLSFEDCALVAYAEINDATPLYTFDKKLAKSSPHAELLS